MKVLISEATDKFYQSDLIAFDQAIEIYSINPSDSKSPSWEFVPECDAFFMNYEFMFAVRDNPELFKPLLSLSKRMKFIQSGFAGMDAPILQSILSDTDALIANAASIYGIPIAHYVFSQILRWNKRIDQHIKLQELKEWSPYGGDVTSKVGFFVPKISGASIVFPRIVLAMACLVPIFSVKFFIFLIFFSQI